MNVYLIINLGSNFDGISLIPCDCIWQVLRNVKNGFLNFSHTNIRLIIDYMETEISLQFLLLSINNKAFDF